ncbi:hypothetical protein FISHEDRAFT_58717 [Fistulina hepatica ATCC 64428]|uniref:Uncharacterized protein n=1 Tax=Fistulina hepatica ATCC 64428 TaxID=1128425 RepID=A0A0D7AFQ9_9AGAR|nr:hypothetical protein FISHEDRAFT_58717 [Fistulina hepatica ATCC 64428]
MTPMSSSGRTKRARPYPSLPPLSSSSSIAAGIGQQSKINKSNATPETQDLAPGWSDPLANTSSAPTSFVFEQVAGDHQSSSVILPPAPLVSLTSQASAATKPASTSVTEIIDWPSGRMPPFQDMTNGPSSGTASAPKPISYPDLVKTVTAQGHLPGELSENEKYILSRVRVFRDKELQKLNAEGLNMRNKVLELQCRVRLLEAVVIGLGGELPNYDHAMIVM